MINRVNKKVARRVYNEGGKVLIFAKNLRPDFFGIVIDKKSNYGRDFDKLVAAYEYYNCINNETGRYAGYIIN